MASSDASSTRLFHGHATLVSRSAYFLLAALIGTVVSLATLLLIEAIGLVQWVSYGAASETRFASIAAEQPWWRVLLVPVIGGLVVGAILRYLPGRRYHGIADVMETCAFNSGRMGVRSGIGAAIAASVSLGAGAPLGREGPAVHIGASLSAWLAERLNLDRSRTLALLGCGAAAAVTTSFNAPLAGVLFALEVIVGYYTLRVFAPVVIASMAAVVVRNALIGSEPLFAIGEYPPHAAWELLLFALLGIVAALLVKLFIVLVSTIREACDRMQLPLWMRPALAGLLIGVIAIQFPMILSIGYEPTRLALEQSLDLGDLLVLLFLKTLGTAIALGGEFAGGVFSPSVFIGAMLGGSFILLLGTIAPFSSSQGLYSVAGMAAVSSAMLGAPISTVLIVFELTRDYGVTLAVMTAAAFASATMQLGEHASFFRWQLANRGVNISAGRDLSLLMTHTIDRLVTQSCAVASVHHHCREVEVLLGQQRRRIAVMLDDDQTFRGSIELRELIAHRNATETNPLVAEICHAETIAATRSTNVVTALQMMADNDIDYLPVVALLETGEDNRHVFEGLIYKADLLAEHYAVLRKARDEEFGVA